VKKKKIKIILITIAVIAVVWYAGVYVINKVFATFFLSQMSGSGYDILTDAAGNMDGTKPGAAVNGGRTGKAPQTSNKKTGSADVSEIDEPSGRKETDQGAGMEKDSPNGSDKTAPGKEPYASPKPKRENDSGKSGSGAEAAQSKEEKKPADRLNAISGKVREIERKVSMADKFRVMAILTPRLKSEDVAQLRALLNGDVNDSKLGLAKKILSVRVTKAEKEELKSIFYKYAYLLGQSN